MCDLVVNTAVTTANPNPNAHPNFGGPSSLLVSIGMMFAFQFWCCEVFVWGALIAREEGKGL